MHVTSRPLSALVAASVSGVLLAQTALLAPVASAQCADPRGNSYCTNGGQVTFSSPPTQTPATKIQNPNPPTNVKVQNPNPPTNVNVQNPNPSTNVNVQNPNPPTNVNVQNPNAGDSGAQNPNAGDSGAQNPNAPISMAGGTALTVDPDGGAPGDMVTVSGQGFGGNNFIWFQVTDSAGNVLDTDARAYSCVETDSVLINLYQDRGWGCSSGAQPGPLTKSNPDGTVAGAIQIPPTAAPGPAKVCALSVNSPACTTITVDSGG